jgi:hypothetical protein
MLDEASEGEKKPARAKQTRQRILDKVLRPGETPNRFADPAGKF